MVIYVVYIQFWLALHIHGMGMAQQRCVNITSAQSDKRKVQRARCDGLMRSGYERIVTGGVSAWGCGRIVTAHGGIVTAHGGIVTAHGRIVTAHGVWPHCDCAWGHCDCAWAHCDCAWGVAAL